MGGGERNVGTYQPPWRSVLVLQEGERISHTWGANHEVAQMGVVNGTSQMVKVRIKGFLVLTNQRIVFVKERGVFGKSYHIDLSVALEKVTGISMGGLVIKYVSLSGPAGESIFHIGGVSNETDFRAFWTMIQDHISRRQQSIEAEKKKERVHIMLDFGFLRDYMSKGGLSLQVVKCPQCGAPMSLPKEGNQATCSHCGSTVFAQDIMEKVKELIG
jgi:DNA-directed RNA polymerase subunit RPC12/RpoP